MNWTKNQPLHYRCDELYTAIVRVEGIMSLLEQGKTVFAYKKAAQVKKDLSVDLVVLREMALRTEGDHK